MYDFIRTIIKSLRDYIDRGLAKFEHNFEQIEQKIEQIEEDKEYDLVLSFYSPPDRYFPTFEGIINDSVLTVVSGNVNNVITKLNNNEDPGILIHCEYYDPDEHGGFKFSTDNIDVYKLSYQEGSYYGDNEDYGIRLSWICYETIDNMHKYKRITVDFDNTNTIINGNIDSFQYQYGSGGGSGVTSWNDLQDKPFGKEGEEKWVLEKNNLAFAGESIYTMEVNEDVVNLFSTTGNTVYVYWNDGIYGCNVQYHNIAMYYYVEFDSYKIFLEGNTLTLSSSSSMIGDYTLGLLSDVVTIKKIDEEFLPEHSWNNLIDKPFYETISEIDVVPTQDVTFWISKASLTAYFDPCYDLGLCEDPSSFTAVLEINDEVIEAEMNYYYVATGTFGDYEVDLGAGTIRTTNDWDGVTCTIRLYAIKNDIKKIDEKFLPDTSSSESSQSDWNQNDETASDYIKNKPFYKTEGIYLVEPITLTFDAGSQTPNESINLLGDLTEEAFEIQWNSNIYHCEFSWNSWGEVYEFGTFADDTPIRNLVSSSGVPYRKDTSVPEQVTFAIGRPLPSYVKIPQDYLPNLIGATSQSAGSHGIVPAPPSGGQDLVLLGSGKWGVTAGNIIKVVENEFTGSTTNAPLFPTTPGWYFLKGYFRFGNINGKYFENYTLAFIDKYIEPSYDDGYRLICTILDSKYYNDVQIPAWQSISFSDGKYVNIGEVTSWNDLTDKPFGEDEEGNIKHLDEKFVPDTIARKSDDTLETTSKELVGAINELNSKFGDIESICDEVIALQNSYIQGT